MRKLAPVLAGLATVLASLGVQPALGQAPVRPDQAEFRSLYKELVETNTTLSEGNCTLAAERMAARLRAAGMADSQLTLFSTPDHPKEGGLVAVLPGKSKTARPMLLLGHIDVVEAKRADWTRDPFTLIEEGGYFYGRGSFDDKAMAAVWVDTLARFAREKRVPARTIKMALTCGEETTFAFNGTRWLVDNRPDLVSAEFALNEVGGGMTDGKGVSEGGKLLFQTIQAGEKGVQNFRIETTNPGGHSSLPVPDNAIYQLAQALVRLQAHEFALEFSDTTRAYFTEASKLNPGPVGEAMARLVANPSDRQAEALVNRDRTSHAILHTTCVATLLDGGHANNALPQRAGANINCRILPGHTGVEVRDELLRVIADPGVRVTMEVTERPTAMPPPLDHPIIATVRRLSAVHFPGVPVIPGLLPGATDGIYLGKLGIPAYGVPGFWINPDNNGKHGLNERIEVASLYAGRDYLFDLVKELAGK